MADVNKLVFSIIRFLEDQKTAGNLSDEGVEGLEGLYIYSCNDETNICVQMQVLK